MMGLTHQQAKALAIISQANAHGTAPTYDELANGLGLAGKSGVHRIILALERRGAIRRLPGCSRALEAVDPLGGLSTGELLEMRRRIDGLLAGRRS